MNQAKIAQINFKFTNKQKGMKLIKTKGYIVVELCNLKPSEVLVALSIDEFPLINLKTLNFINDFDEKSPSEVMKIGNFISAKDIVDIFIAQPSIQKLHFENVDFQHIDANEIQQYCIKNKRQVDVTIVGISPFIQNM